MKKLLTVSSLMLLCCVSLMNVGCAAKEPEPLPVVVYEPEEEAVLIPHAESMLGVDYVYGGESPEEGFDCSGFVQWAYNQVGVDLPRTARDQSQFGEHIAEMSELEVGDVVTFRNPRRGYHTGIYLGDNKFIHSPRTNKDIRVSSLEVDYFTNYFTGARRVMEVSEAEIEAAERLLAEVEVRN